MFHLNESNCGIYFCGNFNNAEYMNSEKASGPQEAVPETSANIQKKNNTTPQFSIKTLPQRKRKRNGELLKNKNDVPAKRELFPNLKPTSVSLSSCTVKQHHSGGGQVSVSATAAALGLHHPNASTASLAPTISTTTAAANVAALSSTAIVPAAASTSNLTPAPSSSSSSDTTTPLFTDDIMIINRTQMINKLSARILQSMSQKSNRLHRYQQHQQQTPKTNSSTTTMSATETSTTATTSNDDDIIGKKMRPVSVITHDIRLQILHVVLQDHTYANAMPTRLPTDFNGQQMLTGVAAAGLTTVVNLSSSRTNPYLLGSPSAVGSGSGNNVAALSAATSISNITVSSTSSSSTVNTLQQQQPWSMGGGATSAVPTMANNSQKQLVHSSYTTLNGQSITRLQQQALNEVTVEDPVLSSLLSSEKLAKAVTVGIPSDGPKMLIVFSEPISETMPLEFRDVPELSQTVKSKLCGLNKQAVESLVHNGPKYDKILATLKNKNFDVSRDARLGPIADFRREYLLHPQFAQEIRSVLLGDQKRAQYTTPIKSNLRDITFHSPSPVIQPAPTRFSAQMRQDTPMRRVKFGGTSTIVYDCGLSSIINSVPLKNAFEKPSSVMQRQPVIISSAPMTSDFMDDPPLDEVVKQYSPSVNAFTGKNANHLIENLKIYKCICGFVPSHPCYLTKHENTCQTKKKL